MLPYTIEFSAAAARQFRKLVVESRARLAPHIDALAKNPRPSGAAKLTGEAHGYRLRVGDNRILYEVDDKRRTVLVVTVGHRRDVYRRR